MEKELLRLFLNMHGISSKLADILYAAGFNDTKKLKSAQVSENR